MAPIYIYRKPPPFVTEGFKQNGMNEMDDNHKPKETKESLETSGRVFKPPSNINVYYELQRLQNKIDFYESIFIVMVVIVLIKFFWDLISSSMKLSSQVPYGNERIYIMRSGDEWEAFGGRR